MDLDELRGVQSTERQRDSLQHLRDSFYEDVAAYVASRKHRRDERAASVDNPFSDEQVRRLSDEIETAEEVVESLYERRVGKVVKLASFAAADAPVETEGMTAEEAALFEDLVDRIERNKETVLAVLEGGAGVDLDAPTGTEPSTAAADPDRGTEGGAAAGGATAGEATAGDATASGASTADTSTADTAAGDVLADAMGGQDGARDDTHEGAPQTDTRERTPSADTPERTSPADGSDAVSSVQPDEEPSNPPDEPDHAPPRGGTDDARKESGPVDEPPAGTVEDRTTVRITRDVGRILGVDDREYDLESEDVVTLPAANAGPLVDRDAAERLE